MAVSLLEAPIYKQNHDRLIDKINHHVHQNEKFFSLEFFPPRTSKGTYNLFEKCDRFSKGQPLFCDMTYKMNKEIDNDEITDEFVDMAVAAQDITQCHTMLQLNASLLSEETVVELLLKARLRGLSTIMAVSDWTVGSQTFDDFSSTADLIRFVRAEFGSYFTICVAGYPNCICSPDVSYEQSFEHLLEQVDAGADFIITQMVFDANDFIKFTKHCRTSGIKTPIIPGIFPIQEKGTLQKVNVKVQSYGCIRKLNRYSKVKIPDKIMNVLKPIRQNDEAVLKYGVYLTVEICKLLLQSTLCAGLHFFTLNRETATTDILKQIGLWREATVSKRVLPWLPDSSEARNGEDVRPIFWSHRPESYKHRTSKWEEFPNGRWGDSSSASYGNFKDYRLIFARNDNILIEYRKMWGEELRSLEDVYDIFIAFLSKTKNRNGYQVHNIPWAEEELSPETNYICDDLIFVNTHGFLTINSQPNVNCTASSDKTFGWGSPGGYVFQKAYLEFFCNEEDATNLLAILPNYSTVNYHLINHSGTKNFSNTEADSSNAVTWGVFTGSLIKQPTIVNPVSFQFWKDEAFELWLQQWGKLYPKESISHKIIQSIHDDFYLVNLVDNDYVKGNCLFQLVRQAIQMRK